MFEGIMQILLKCKSKANTVISIAPASWATKTSKNISIVTTNYTNATNQQRQRLHHSDEFLFKIKNMEMDLLQWVFQRSVRNGDGITWVRFKISPLESGFKKDTQASLADGLHDGVLQMGYWSNPPEIGCLSYSFLSQRCLHSIGSAKEYEYKNDWRLTVTAAVNFFIAENCFQ